MKTSIVAAVLLVPAQVLAHAGHGATDPGTARHYAAEPVHALGIVAAALAVGAGVALWGWLKARQLHAR